MFILQYNYFYDEDEYPERIEIPICVVDESKKDEAILLVKERMIEKYKIYTDSFDTVECDEYGNPLFIVEKNRNETSICYRQIGYGYPFKDRYYSLKEVPLFDGREINFEVW